MAPSRVVVVGGNGGRRGGLGPCICFFAIFFAIFFAVVIAALVTRFHTNHSVTIDMTAGETRLITVRAACFLAFGGPRGHVFDRQGLSGTWVESVTATGPSDVALYAFSSTPPLSARDTVVIPFTQSVAYEMKDDYSLHLNAYARSCCGLHCKPHPLAPPLHQQLDGDGADVRDGRLGRRFRHHLWRRQL